MPFIRPPVFQPSHVCTNDLLREAWGKTVSACVLAT